ncbi:MAG: CAP domain-containing protein [Pseudomonadota bacterium]
MFDRARIFLIAAALFLAPSVAATACTLPAGAETAVAEVLARTNAFRMTRGRARVSLSVALTQAARAHACYMAQSGQFDHRGAGGSSVGDRALAAGYRWGFVAENIALGHTSGEAVFEGWRGSPGHRETMLERDARDIGIAVAVSNGQLYWAMVVASPL